MPNKMQLLLSRQAFQFSTTPRFLMRGKWLFVSNEELSHLTTPRFLTYSLYTSFMASHVSKNVSCLIWKISNPFFMVMYPGGP